VNDRQFRYLRRNAAKARTARSARKLAPVQRLVDFAVGRDPLRMTPRSQGCTEASDQHDVGRFEAARPLLVAMCGSGVRETAARRPSGSARPCVQQRVGQRPSLPSSATTCFGRVIGWVGAGRPSRLAGCRPPPDRDYCSRVSPTQLVRDRGCRGALASNVGRLTPRSDPVHCQRGVVFMKVIVE